MSESRTVCPICAREPGEQHHDECPRSTLKMRDFALGQKLYRRLRWYRFVWQSVRLVPKRDIPEGVPIRRAIARSKKPRELAHPIDALVPAGLVPIRQPLFVVPIRGTYERAKHGPLLTVER